MKLGKILDVAAWYSEANGPRVSIALFDEQVFLTIEEAEAYLHELRGVIADAKKGEPAATDAA